MTTTTDFTALCAAIDAGDDDALSIMADWLEETGDERATGMREVIRLAARPTQLRLDMFHPQFSWGWVLDAFVPVRWAEGCVSSGVIRRLAGENVHPIGQAAKVPGARHAAYLALAEALGEV